MRTVKGMTRFDGGWCRPDELIAYMKPRKYKDVPFWVARKQPNRGPQGRNSWN